MNVLLIEPAYKNKYPPLGLMKISAFHKQRGDSVCFVKGLDKDIRTQSWDRIYITSLFSFYWVDTIKTIKYYEFSVKDPSNFFIGGPMATLMANEIREETGFLPIKGLLNEKGKLRIAGDHHIDSMVPDYGMLNEIKYKYPASNAYFAYMTRGCVRKCAFCAVPKLEPKYVDYVPLKKQLKQIAAIYGEKKDLLLLDNNVLASSKFDDIVDEIKEAGFVKGASLNKARRNVDFNQGIDLRKLTREKMKRLAELPIFPLRIAFDHISLKEQYIQKIRWAAEFGINRLSNYILYNFHDTPEDFYERLKINVDLNEELGTQIYSFPMKYIPITNKDRKFVGEHWTPRYLRSIQCILQATHGVVSPRKDFFEAAFGKTLQEFRRLLIMPDRYIIYRESSRKNGAAEWDKLLNSLPARQKNDFLRIIHANRNNDEREVSQYPAVNLLLDHYKKSSHRAIKDD